MASFVVLTERLVLLIIFCISLFADYLSYSAIWRLQLYESATKKAARISSEVGRQMQKTRTTQSAGALAALASTVCSIFVLTRKYDGTDGSATPLVLAAGCATLSYGAKSYVGEFWKGSAKVPLGNTEYNDAVRATENLCGCLNVQCSLWLGFAGVVFTARFLS